MIGSYEQQCFQRLAYEQEYRIRALGGYPQLQPLPQYKTTTEEVPNKKLLLLEDE